MGWSKEDRDKAVWWSVRERQRCNQCGTRPVEWDPAQGGDRNAYRAQLTRCRGCEVTAIEASRHKDPEALGKGIHVSLVKQGRPA